MLSASKKKFSTIHFDKKSLKLAFLLKSLGHLNSIYIISKSKKLIRISPFFYKRQSFYKSIRLISTPSKSFSIKLKSLKLIGKSLGSSVLILETSYGLLTHNRAIKLGVSGKLLCILV